MPNLNISAAMASAMASSSSGTHLTTSNPIAIPIATTSTTNTQPPSEARRPQFTEQQQQHSLSTPYPLASSVLPTPWPQFYQHQHQQTQRPLSSYPVRTPFLHPSHAHMSSVSLPIRGSSSSLNSNSHTRAQPKRKVASSLCFAPGPNGHEEPLDKGADDLFVSVRDRNIKISDGASIYTLCRSWLRNGYPEGNQPRCGDFMKSLPKPSPITMSESSLLKRKENVEETEFEGDKKSIENLNEKELLQRHIKRAKRVRARLREERLQRIARYKSRLALLLPPVIEQCGNVQAPDPETC